MTKKELIEQSTREWKLLGDLLSTLTDEQKLAPGVIGEWSVKDLMGHISAWEAVSLDRLGRLRRNEPIEYVLDEQNDAWNKRFFEQRRDWKLTVVEGEFESVHDMLMKNIQELPTDLWEKNVADVVGWLKENTFVHYEHHRRILESKLGHLQSIRQPQEEKP